MFTILLCNVNWWMYFEYIAMSGFPLTFFTIIIVWNLRLFPDSMYTTFEISFIEVLTMIALIDGLQTLWHYAAHTWLRYTFIGKSHMIHHVNRNPKPHDAFYTGFVDAVIQLLIPLYTVIIIVQPSRYSAILFGSMYSWWLLFIHSDPRIEYPWLEFFHIVTPRNHHIHHQYPTKNFSNIFDLFNAAKSIYPDDSSLCF